jgi:hypothetical protein
VLIGINLGFTGADGAGVGTKSISRLKSCLPTASGCHQEEAETSVRRRFLGSSQSRQIRLTAPQCTTLNV